MRTRKFFWNTIVTILLQLTMVVSGLIIPRVMLLAYGSETNGLISSISQFINYFNILEAGLSGAATYALYKPLADRNEYEINRILSASRKFYIQTGWIFSIMVVVLSILYPLYIKKPGFTNLEVALLVLVLGINGALEFFTLAKYRVLLTADQKVYVISLSSIVQWVVYTVIIVVFTKLQVNVILTRTIALLAIFVRTLLLVLYCRKRYAYLDYSVAPNMTALDRRWSALYLQILGLIQSSGPIVILTIVCRDLQLVSIYSVYATVIAGIGTILGVFSNGLSASFGDVIARGQEDILKRAYREFEILYHFVGGIVYTLSFVLLIPFIKIYTSGVTDANYIQPVVAALFVLNTMMYNLKTPQGMLVISAGMYKETQVQSTLQGIILLVSGAILCYFFGLPGLLMGMVLSNLYRTIDLTFFVPHHITHTRVWDTIKQYLIIAIGQCVVLCFYSRVASIEYVDGYLAWCVLAVKIGIFTVIVFATMHLLLNRKEWPGILKRFQLLVRKNTNY